jgi:hypothetical protein
MADAELANLSTAVSRRHPRPVLSTPYEAPRTPTERVVAELWSELLGIDGIGINDSFFECGGHSLLAVQMLSRIRDSFPAEIGIAMLFEAPTIAEFSRSVDMSRQSTSEATTASSCVGAELEHKYL